MSDQNRITNRFATIKAAEQAKREGKATPEQEMLLARREAAKLIGQTRDRLNKSKPMFPAEKSPIGDTVHAEKPQAEPSRELTIKAAISILREPEAEPQLYRCTKCADVETGDASENCPRCGRQTYPVARAGSVIAQHAAIKDPVAKSAFYRANKAAYDREFNQRNRNRE